MTPATLPSSMNRQLDKHMMNKQFRTMLFAGAAGALSLYSGTAFANNTPAGTVIENTATVDYQVGGIAQTEVTATSRFTVDRKIVFTVDALPTQNVVVFPGTLRAVTRFQITNASNETLDFGLSAAQAAGGAGPFGGTDNFDVTNLSIYRDSNGNGEWDAGDQQTDFVDELAADTTTTVFIVADVAIDRVNGDLSVVTLTAQAREGGDAGSQGAIVTATSGSDDPDAKDTVFADAGGATDSPNDGLFSASHAYAVSAPELAVVKTNRVIEDPVSGTTQPKAIPGASVEYCIAVTNAGGDVADATNVIVTDQIPADLTYVASSLRVNGTLASPGICDGGTPGGDVTGNAVTAPLNDIAEGQTRTVHFRATIN